MTCLAVTVTLTPVSPPLLPSLMTNNKQVAPNISVPLWLQSGFYSEWTETPRPHPPQQMDGIFPSITVQNDYGDERMSPGPP